MKASSETMDRESREPAPVQADADDTRAGREVRRFLAAGALEGAVVWAVLLFARPSLILGGAPPVGGRAVLLAGVAIGLTVLFAWGNARARLDPTWSGRIARRAFPHAGDERVLRLSVGFFYGSVLFGIAVLFGASLWLNPARGSILADWLRRGLPILVWLILVALQLSVLLHRLGGRSRGHTALTFAVGGVLTFLVLAYWFVAERRLLFINTVLGTANQDAYVEYARTMRETGYRYPGDFNRMPLYPFLLSLVWRPGMTDTAFFVQAKYFSLFLSLALVVGLAIILLRRFGAVPAVILTLIVAFGVFVYIAGWVQSEPLFYVLNSVLFLMMWRMLQRPTLRLAIGAGVVAALAHLTKASVVPGLAVFLVFAVARGGIRWLGAGQRGASKDSGAVQVLLPLLTVAVFLAVLSPYLITSRRVTGHYFYNVNSTFYMWYDNWDQAIAGTKAHGDRVGWPEMPAEQIPSPAKYAREHTFVQAMQRVIDGAHEVMNNVYHSYGYLDYIVLFGAVLVLVAALRWRRALHLASENLVVILFMVVYFATFLLLYFWYAPIAAGDRLILALFIPLLVSSYGGIQLLLEDARVALRGRSISWMVVLNVALLTFVAADVLLVIARSADGIGVGG
jgi:hypothetical protein